MKKHVSTALLALMLATTSALLAHGGHKHKTIMGTVKSVDASHIDLTTTDGKKVSVPLVKTTTFMRGDKTVLADQVKVGTRVVILLGEDDRSAQRVKIGAAPKMTK